MSSSQSLVLPLRLGEGAEPEYTMIELQGVLESDEGPLGAQPLGAFRTAGDEATLVIGTHELKGRRTRLPKPLLVTQPDAGGVAVLGVVRAKFVFCTRPNTLAVQ